ncbi:MAG: aminotransferase class I/II-fold pyridoxal phosphate-dependent enzyme [Candidatus Omnitrophota bacterium]
MDSKKFTFTVASEKDRNTIYALRHEIYAEELHQHSPNADRTLSDLIDKSNFYIVAKKHGRIAGFVSLTPPGSQSYSIDKYFLRHTIPFEFDNGLFEVRLLSVINPYRRSLLAGLLMYAAFRWAEDHGGTRIVAIGRQEILRLYHKAGLKALGRRVKAGAVTYELLSQTISQLRGHMDRYKNRLDKLKNKLRWELPIPFDREKTCYHGGAFFKSIGEQFDNLDRRYDVINADVLDAWYPPSPNVIKTLQKHLPWLIRTSPPTGCEGMINIIARMRQITPDCILPGSGSSDLIFLALRHFLNQKSKVLILDPTYGEYAYLLEEVVRCRLDRYVLSRKEGYIVNLSRLGKKLSGASYNMVILVNPNSPTGRFIDKKTFESFLAQIPKNTLVWIDETYIEYVGPGQSLESFATATKNTIICKSMSKVYALSGLRCAYLCASSGIITPLKRISPPWAVSLPAQVAAVEALQDPGYYEKRYQETHVLRNELSQKLSRELHLDVVPGIANFLLCHLPEHGLTADAIVTRCQRQNLFLRDAGSMGKNIGKYALRISVKDRKTNLRMIEILKGVLSAD